MKDLHEKNTKSHKRGFIIGRRRQAQLPALHGQYFEDKKLRPAEKLYKSAGPGPGVASRAGLADRFEELLRKLQSEVSV